MLGECGILFSTYIDLTVGTDLIVKSNILIECSQNAGTVSAVFPLPEPTDLQLASQVTFDDVQADLTQLEKRINDCDKKIQKVSQQKDEKTRQPFKDTMSCLLEQNRLDLQQQVQAVQECKKR